MKNSKIKIFAAIVVIILTGAAFWFFLSSDTEIFKSLNFKSLNIETFKSLNDESAEDQRSTPLDQNLTGQVSEKSADISETYTNPKYGFSFNHPKEFSVSEFIEGEADVILVKDETGDGFQISIIPFDEPFDSALGKPGPITKERILKDIPDMRISNDKEILVGGFDKLTAGGETALSFTSKDTSGETFEIWFVRSGYLYQITSYKSFENKMMEILSTWKFQ